MSKLICIISHQHLSRNPRVLKESIALKKAGFQVTILTSVYSEELLKEDIGLLENSGIKYIFYNDLIKKNLVTYRDRATRKFGRWLNSVGIENKWALGYAPTNCLKMAEKINADLFICHQELPTYIGTLLLKQNRKVGFDLEDWYSKDLLSEARKFLPLKLLETVENKAVNYGQLVYTTSSPMAEKMSIKYSSKKPEVIYNSFNSYHSSIINDSETIRLIWISQTIGPGRGLEDFIQCLNDINDVSFELSLRGKTSSLYQDQLIHQLTNHKHSVKFLPLIANIKIQEDLTRYDIGLALEPNFPINKDLTISNKIFHYLSVGLPVIASNTAGQFSLADDFKAISYFNDKEELKLKLLQCRKNQLREERKEILSIYKEKYDWRIMEDKLQKLVTDCIH